MSQKTIFREVYKETSGNPTFLLEVLSEPERNDMMDIILNIPLNNFGKSCTDVRGQRSIDGYSRHPTSRMPKSLKIALGLTKSLKTGRIACFHVDADDISRAINHKIP